MLIRYGTQAALQCGIDKVLRVELRLGVRIHILTHSIETIPAYPGARTHWLRDGDRVKTSRVLVAFPAFMSVVQVSHHLPCQQYPADMAKRLCSTIPPSQNCAM